MSPASKTTYNIKDSQTGGKGYLTECQVAMIDEALNEIGEFGEVRLIVEKRRLRFLVTLKSSDVLKALYEADR
jgi:hypothetical protein